MNVEKPPLGVFGAGWVGLVTSACFAELGHQVVVRDVVPEKIEALHAGRVPFHEPGLAELIERNRERLTFTLDVDELKGGTRNLLLLRRHTAHGFGRRGSRLRLVGDRRPRRSR